MMIRSRRASLFAAFLIIATSFAPLFALTASAAIGVRANAGASQVANQGDTLIFDGSRSYTLSGNNLTYTWDFNQSDGIQADATGVLASHQYNETGIFTVTLTATDGAQSDTDTTTAVVTSNNGTVPGVPNLPPVAIAPRNQQGRQNVSMVFDGTRSFDPNGDNLTWTWDMNELDGLTPGGDANGSVVSWIYYSPGIYNITMIVSDGNSSDSARTTALITPDNGTVIPGVNVPPVAVAEGDNIGQVNTTFSFNANRSFDADGDTMHFTWDFNGADGSTRNIDAEGQVVFHKFTQTGFYNVTLLATDAQGESSDTMRVIVTNQAGGVPGVSNIPPIAIITEPIPGSRHDINESIFFNGSRSFDPDSTSAVICKWTFYDGINGGSVDVNGCTTYHHFADSGFKEVLLLVQDIAGATAPNTVTIIINQTGGGPLNRQPNGQIEGPTTGQVRDLLNFTANFTDTESDPMNYSWYKDISQGIGGTPDATSRNVTFTYTASGRFTIAVLVTDGAHRNVPVIQTLNIQISARATHAPSAFAGNDTSGQAGSGIVFDCRGTDTDGNITMLEWDFDGDGTYDYRNPDSGYTIYTYTRDGNFTATCRVTDNDGLTGTDSRRVDVRPAPNDPPVADAGPDKPNETQGLQTFFHGTGSDTDGNISLFEWDFNGDGTFDSANSSSGDAFHIFPDAGTYFAVLRVTDNRNARGTDTAAVTVKRNQPPSADAGPDQSVNAGDQVYFSGARSRDAEGAITKFSWDLDSSDGIQEDFTGVAPTHIYTKGGNYLVTLTVYDSLGQSDTDTMFVNVAQHAGVTLAVDSDGSKEVAPDQQSSYLLTVTNTGDGTDTYTLTVDGDLNVVGWYSLEARQVVNLEAGGVRVVRLTVTVPRAALVDDATPVTTTAVSGADPSKHAEVSVYTTVKEIVRIDVSVVSFPAEVKPGEAAEVKVRVTNSGNRDAKVSFVELSGDSAWLGELPPPTTVRPSRSTEFTFQLAVPADASPGQHQLSVTAKVSQSTVAETQAIQILVKGGSFLPTLTPAALIAGIVVAAGLIFFTRPPKRHE
jgi:large repetitive protein